MALSLPVPVNPTASSFPSGSLYVGDLHPDVTEATLFEKFSQIGPILSIRVCRDAITGRSLGYGYVNFYQPADADYALNTMNFDVIHGKPVRIMWSQRDPSLRRSGMGNIFINHLDKSIDNRGLYDVFSGFGNILSCKVACDENGPKGHGFVQYETQEAAATAIANMNGRILNNRKIFVGPFKSPNQQEADFQARIQEYTNIYIKNFGEGLNDESLMHLFGKFGRILSAKVMTDESGKSKRFGFVRFKFHADAQRAVEEMDGKELNGKNLYVSRAQKKKERQAKLTKKFEEMKQNNITRQHGVNLYVKNLADRIDDERLRQEFSPFGTVTSAKVMVEGGRKKGFGFVCFSSPEEASKALAEMNGRIVASKPLYVCFAQRKEERRAHLISQYVQKMASMTALSNLAAKPYQTAPPGYLMATIPQAQACAAYYPPSQVDQLTPISHGIDQGAIPYPFQNMLGATGPAIPTPPISTMTSASAQFPQVISSYPQCTASPSPLTMGPRPALRTELQYQYTEDVCNPQQLNAPPQATARQPAVHAQGSRSLITSMLAHAPPQEQKQILGQWLYPLIQATHPTLASKITDTLLEMDNSEVLHMLESPESLRSKVDEALAVLQACQDQESATKPLTSSPDSQP